jgi:hypothetical protein
MGVVQLPQRKRGQQRRKTARNWPIGRSPWFGQTAWKARILRGSGRCGAQGKECPDWGDWRCWQSRANWSPQRYRESTEKFANFGRPERLSVLETVAPSELETNSLHGKHGAYCPRAGNSCERIRGSRVHQSRRPNAVTVGIWVAPIKVVPGDSIATTGDPLSSRQPCSRYPGRDPVSHRPGPIAPVSLAPSLLSDGHCHAGLTDRDNRHIGVTPLEAQRTDPLEENRFGRSPTVSKPSASQTPC